MHIEFINVFVIVIFILISFRVGIAPCNRYTLANLLLFRWNAKRTADNYRMSSERLAISRHNGSANWPEDCRQ
jgi:hypothetical protein